MDDTTSTVADALAAGSRTLEGAGIESSDAEARILLAWAMGVDANELALRQLSDPAVPAEAVGRYRSGLARRCERTPLQHITGSAPFRRLDLAVGPGVFIPRPETELLAQWGIDFLRSRPRGSRRVVDMCTGTSAIALSLATEVGGTSAVGIEVSPTAARWARENVRAHTELLDRCGSDVVIHEADALEYRPSAPVDLVISNPPYVDRLRQPEIPEVDADPDLALYGGGEDGMDFPRRLVRRAAELLATGGALAVEHAEYQSGLAAGAFADAGFSRIEVRRDYTGRERFTVGFREHEETHVAAL